MAGKAQGMGTEGEDAMLEDGVLRIGDWQIIGWPRRWCIFKQGHWPLGWNKGIFSYWLTPLIEVRHYHKDFKR